jgi:hypothetical protein
MWRAFWATTCSRRWRRRRRKRATLARQSGAWRRRWPSARSGSGVHRGASAAAPPHWSVRGAARCVSVVCTGALMGGRDDFPIRACQVALFQGKVLHLANVGDCRALVVRTTSHERLTIDHKASAPSERARIVKQGGKVDGERIVLKKWVAALHDAGRACVWAHVRTRTHTAARASTWAGRWATRCLSRICRPRPTFSPMASGANAPP